MHAYKTRKARLDGEKGFSIVELLIAIVIFLIVTASIYGLLQVGRIDRNRSSRRSDIMKNARVAIHLIGRDALNAGLGYNRVGGLAPDDWVSTTFAFPTGDDNDVHDFITSVMARNDINANDLGPNQTDFIAFCSRDMGFNDSDLLYLDSVRDHGDPSIPSVQTRDPAALAGVGASVNHLYLVESPTTQVAVMATEIPDDDHIVAAPGDPMGLNQALNGTGWDASVLRACVDADDQFCTDYVATLKRFSIVSYRVRQDGTLVRTTYGNNVDGTTPADQMDEQPLAYNVQDLQIEYVLSDGTVTDAPTTASPGPDNDWNTDADNIADQINLIRQINIRITVLSTETDEQSGRPEAITLTATFSTRNMEYTAG